VLARAVIEGETGKMGGNEDKAGGRISMEIKEKAREDL